MKKYMSVLRMKFLNGMQYRVAALAGMATQFAWGGLLVLLSLAFNMVICNLLLKPLVARTRPYDLLGYEILVRRLGDYSFPSGHTSASFAAATAIYAIDRRWGAAAYVLAALIGFSRLYLGVHFPTDVLAGAVVGILAAKAAQCLLEKKMHFNK